MKVYITPILSISVPRGPQSAAAPSTAGRGDGRGTEYSHNDASGNPKMTEIMPAAASVVNSAIAVLTNSTYSIIRSSRTKDTFSTAVIEDGLDLQTARRKADQLQDVERKAKPNQTSWTYDIFYISKGNEMPKRRQSANRKRGEYLTEKLVGFRMKPDAYEKLRSEAAKAGKTIAEVINQSLAEKFGWHPDLFVKSSNSEAPDFGK